MSVTKDQIKEAFLKGYDHASEFLSLDIESVTSWYLSDNTPKELRDAYKAGFSRHRQMADDYIKEIENE